MNIQKKEVFTKEDILSFTTDCIEFLDIDKKDVKIEITWENKFLDKSYWLNYSNDFYNLKRLAILFISVNNIRLGYCEINYNSYTDFMSLKFGITLNQNKVFNNIVTQYSKVINLNNTHVEESWEISIPKSQKETRLITLENLNKKIVRATSIMVKLDYFQGYQTSSLDNTESFRFDVNINYDDIINKLKLTYYMEKNPIELKEITDNKPLYELLNEPAEKIQKYVQILEMVHV